MRELCCLTFELEGELIGVVEGEHLLVRRLLIGVEDELSGEHEHRKASFHQLRLSVLLLHWLQLSSDPRPSTLGLRPLTLSSADGHVTETPPRWRGSFLSSSGP